MAFNSIPSSLIQVGKSITRTLWSTYVKDSLDDLDSRMTQVEQSAGKIIIFDELVYIPSAGSSVTNIARYRAASSYDLTDCKVAVGLVSGLTGTLEVDIKTAASPDPTSATSVFTTKPSVAYSGASNYDESSNAVFDLTNKVITAGEYIFLSFSSLPSGGAAGAIQIYLIGEPS